MSKRTGRELSKYITKKSVSLIRRLHGCQIGATEFNGGYATRERVDAILFNGYGSFLIEVKISRSDFFADAKKRSRIDPSKGVGRYRYYACPVGLIHPEELPDKWGLIYVPEGRRKCTMPVGHGGTLSNPSKDTKHPEDGWTIPGYDTYGSERGKYKSPEAACNKFSFDERDMHIEWQYMFYLAKRYKQQQFMDNIL